MTPRPVWTPEMRHVVFFDDQRALSMLQTVVVRPIPSRKCALQWGNPHWHCPSPVPLCFEGLGHRRHHFRGQHLLCSWIPTRSIPLTLSEAPAATGLAGRHSGELYRTCCRNSDQPVGNQRWHWTETFTTAVHASFLAGSYHRLGRPAGLSPPAQALITRYGTLRRVQDRRHASDS